MKWPDVLSRKGRPLRLQGLSWSLLLVIALGLLWVNMHASQEGYNERKGLSWRGGVRHGFPMTWWDSGQQFSIVQGKGLSAQPYGGVQWGGLAVNLLASLGFLALAAAASERLLRKRTRRRAKIQGQAGGEAIHAAPVPVNWGTLLVVLALASGLVWLNLQLQSSPQRSAGGAWYYQQALGWPWAMYEARGPLRRPPGAPVRAQPLGGPPPPIKDVPHVEPVNLRLPEAPLGGVPPAPSLAGVPEAVAGADDEGRRLPPLSTWHFGRIILNIFACAGVALLGGLLSEAWIKRRREPREIPFGTSPGADS